MLRRRAEELKLFGAEHMKHYSDYSLYVIYNGAGPERWPEFARVLLTEILDLFEPAFLLHDLRFNHSDGCRHSWKNANRECMANMERIVCASFPLLTWKFPYNLFQRRRWMAKALAVAAAINSDLCFDAWLEASDCDD